MKTIFFSAAFVAALAVGAGTGSQLFAQTNFGGQPQPNFGGQPQPSFGGQPGGASMPSGPGGGMATGQPGGGFPPNQPAPGGAARPTASAPQFGVNGMAVLDVAAIFKKYPRFLQQMEQMKGKVEAAEKDVKNDQDEYKRMMDQLKNYNAGSPDYKKLEELMLKKQGDVNLKVNIQKKDFMEQEGRIYYTVSREIDDAVRSLATRHNLILVLRFSGDGIDPSDRNDILRGINKQIVYYDQRMDITTLVLNELTRSPSVQPNPQMSTLPVPQRGGQFQTAPR